MSDYGLDTAQFRIEIVRYTLQRIGLWDAASENLVVGTAYQESGLRSLRQKPMGPAFGLFQTEGPTHNDIYQNYLKFNPDLYLQVTRLASHFTTDTPDPRELIGNLCYAAAICRVHYRRVKEDLPPSKDAFAMMQFYIRNYNRGGKATVDEALKHFERAVSEDI